MMAGENSANSPDGKLKISGSEPISTLTVQESDPVLGCLVNIPKEAKSLRKRLGIEESYASIQHFAFVCSTPEFKEASGDISVVVCRGYTNHGDKKFTIRSNHKKVVAPESASPHDPTWLLVSCQEGLKGSRMRKLLKGIQISSEDEPSQICKSNQELMGIGERDGKLVFQPFQITITDNETFCLGRESFRHLKPAGPLLDKEKNTVLGYYWSRENKMVISWLQRGQVVVEIADEIIVTDTGNTTRNGIAAKPRLTIQEIELNIYRGEHETESRVDAKTKVSPGDTLSSLWENDDASFRDQFSTSLDRVYKIKGSVKYWPQLADEYKVSKEDCELFYKSETFSPSERMFRYIEAAKPRLTIEQLLDALQQSGLHDVLRVFSDYINAGYLKKVKFVAELGPLSPNILGQIMVKMDRDKCWRELANQLDIPKRVFEQFDDKLKNNPTRQLLHLLHTRNTKLTVEDVKAKLVILERDDVMVDMGEVPAKIGIDALLNHFTITESIEHKLNREDSFLKNWRQLAELYKEDSLITDEDIQVLQLNQMVHSPTNAMMNHVLREQHPQTVEQLVVSLGRMRRTDGLHIVACHLKGGWSDIEDILQKHP